LIGVSNNKLRSWLDDQEDEVKKVEENQKKELKQHINIEKVPWSSFIDLLVSKALCRSQYNGQILPAGLMNAAQALTCYIYNSLNFWVTCWTLSSSL